MLNANLHFLQYFAQWPIKCQDVMFLGLDACSSGNHSENGYDVAARELPQSQDLQQVQDLSITIFQFELNCSTSFYQTCRRFDDQKFNSSSFPI